MLLGTGRVWWRSFAVLWHVLIALWHLSGRHCGLLSEPPSFLYCLPLLENKLFFLFLPHSFSHCWPLSASVVSLPLMTGCSSSFSGTGGGHGRHLFSCGAPPIYHTLLTLFSPPSPLLSLPQQDRSCFSFRFRACKTKHAANSIIFMLFAKTNCLTFDIFLLLLRVPTTACH